MSKFWAQLVIGLWILLSPWLLGFSDIFIMKWSNVLCGLALVVMSGWEILGKYGGENK
jgi:hypothetical protein